MPRKILTALCTVMIPATAIAAGSEAQLTKEEFYRQQFQGWDAVLWVCDYSDDADHLSHVCQQIGDYVRLQLARTEIAFYRVDKATTFQRAIKASNIRREHGHEPVTLRLNMVNSGPPHIDHAIYVRLAFETGYLHAVEKGDSDDSIDSIPRAGTLELDGRGLIMSGTWADMRNPMINALRNSADQLLGTFLEYAE